MADLRSRRPGDLDLWTFEL